MIFPSGPILVVAAHPDDETIGCGGTIARFGHASVLIVTDPALDTDRYPLGVGLEMLRFQRREECRAASKELGVVDVQFGGYEELNLPRLPQLVRLISRSISALRPTVVLTHHWADLHQDHRMISEATMIAARPYEHTGVQCVLAYPIDATTYPGLTYRFNVFVDITETIAQKLSAFGKYVSEVREYPHPRSTEAIEHHANLYGAKSGYRYAEPFELLWTAVPT